MAISVDPPKANRDLMARLDIRLPLLSDQQGEVAQAWDVWDPTTKIALAATMIVAPGGQIILRYVGGHKSDRPTIETLEAMLDEHRKTAKP